MSHEHLASKSQWELGMCPLSRPFFLQFSAKNPPTSCLPSPLSIWSRSLSKKPINLAYKSTNESKTPCTLKVQFLASLRTKEQRKFLSLFHALKTVGLLPFSAATMHKKTEEEGGEKKERNQKNFGLDLERFMLGFGRNQKGELSSFFSASPALFGCLFE